VFWLALAALDPDLAYAGDLGIVLQFLFLPHFFIIYHFFLL
jgi:hypothetical protein